MAKGLRRIIDRQGDTMLENAIAELLHGGVIGRYMRKSVRVYRERRDTLCQLLKARLSEDVQFRVPEGGMAVWGQFAPDINLTNLANKAYARGLHISDGIIYRSSLGDHNGIRLGFASLSGREIEQSVDVLSAVIRTLR